MNPITSRPIGIESESPLILPPIPHPSNHFRPAHPPASRPHPLPSSRNQYATNKPTSSKRSATASANGAKSRGPAIPAGRARSSQNALRHGLAVRDAALPTVSLVLADESIPDFQLLLDSYLDEFAPTSPIEVELVETMASARWRLRRLANIETTLLANEMETTVDDIHNFFADVDREPDVEDHLAYAFKRLANCGSLHLLNRYEGTINRSYAQAFKQLHLLRSLRIRVQPNEPKQSLQSLPVEPIGDALCASVPDRVGRSGAPKSLPVEPSATGPVLQIPRQPPKTEFTRGAVRRPGLEPQHIHIHAQPEPCKLNCT